MMIATGQPCASKPVKGAEQKPTWRTAGESLDGAADTDGCERREGMLKSGLPVSRDGRAFVIIGARLEI